MKGPASFVKHASEVASFYGFRPVREIERKMEERPSRSSKAPLYSFASAARVCSACVAATPQEPALGYYASPVPLHAPRSVSPRETGEFGLQVVGTAESVGEVLMLKTIAVIADEWGTPVTRLRLNALGDKDSQARFARELTAHVRKNLPRMEAACRAEATKDPFAIYRCDKEACKEIAAESPRPLHFLSEKSRSHFRSMLEHIEHLGLPYDLDDTLVGDERGPHVAFALEFGGKDQMLIGAFGGRFDEYLRRETKRKESIGVGASIYFRKKGMTQGHFALEGRPYKPRVYFAQLGLRAKLQGLTVVEMLRTARIPVFQSFDTAHISNQLSVARDLGVSHVLIMGQREALDGTLIIRSMKNSAQTTLSITEVPRFLKTLR